MKEARQEGSLYRIEWVQRLSEALDRLSRGGVEVVLKLLPTVSLPQVSQMGYNNPQYDEA
ncbi:MAG: hypothetical protein Q7R39_20870 [Dehalococcoidia bacterium]|nr:hypothetical protein [Dehalococcoidia bacterium]